MQNTLHNAEQALADTLARIERLKAERAAKLAASDDNYVDETLQLAREIKKLRTTAAAHRERIAALKRKEKQAARDRIAKQHAAGVARIKKSLPAREAAGKRLDRALVELAQAVAEFEAADKDTFSNWPAALGGNSYAHRLRYTSTLNGDALSSVRKARPKAPGIIRTLIEKLFLFNFANEAARCNAELISELDRAPVVERGQAA